MEQALNVDPEAVRQRLDSAIAQYEELAAQLRDNAPTFPAHAVGAGFEAHGRALAEAMSRMQERNVEFLANRVEGWRQLRSLMDSVEQTDAANASEVGLR
ncbi:hypothetical protein ACUY28_04060 [Corynebacterium sanguinis]|uniref:Uncharacterized protein n=1 Tax=Corynebacterium sanguinis TaxID=2594913 RepID=A0A6C1TZQ8_9CORY|nr:MULTISPECIES: hypothetical protein [Corynebacterium]MBA4504141.1 hypothetical protein [Corynebacterium sanguinis]MCT1412608.1 hypothetical protein [Corynebacterium sanguinis]MCT1413858.1 hypothetical protein [Corynebacterium sanguinis]MCT1425434.1 hypothetical protein [Corynebacterium sanguinis]MCT1444774.1 hypothetical protein [Corynebacterium sanguinis]